MQDLIIVGAGGFGREIYELLPACYPENSFRVKGFLSGNPRDLDGYEIAAPVLASPDDYVPASGDRFLLAIGDVGHRKRIVESLLARGAQFTSLVHPTAAVAKTAQIGAGCVLYPFSTVMNAAVLDDFVLLNIYASAGHDVRIGKYSNICPYATINGFGVIEEEVFLGTHSAVLPGRRVGKGSKVSAGSIAAHDVSPGTLVHGVPGRHTPMLRGS